MIQKNSSHSHGPQTVDIRSVAQAPLPELKIPLATGVIAAFFLLFFAKYLQQQLKASNCRARIHTKTNTAARN
jgi:hypothetical protein